jgi:hypothetical protein
MHRNPVVWGIVLINVCFIIAMAVAPTSPVWPIWLVVVLPLSAIAWVFWAFRLVPCANCGNPIKRNANSCSVCGWSRARANRRESGEPEPPTFIPG